MIEHKPGVLVLVFVLCPTQVCCIATLLLVNIISFINVKAWVVKIDQFKFLYHAIQVLDKIVKLNYGPTAGKNTII